MLHFLSVSFCPLLISSPLLYPILSHPFRPLLQLMLLWHWCKCLSRVLCCCCHPVLYHSTQIIYTFFLFYSLSYHDRVDKAMRDRVVVVTFRLACGIPPILLSFFCSRLKLIETYAGSISIAIALIFPSYLSLQSQKRCQDKFGTSRTAYDTVFSKPRVARLIIFIGICLFVLSFVVDTYEISLL